MGGVEWKAIAPALRFCQRDCGEAILVRLAGELDIASTPAAKRVMLDAATGGRTVLVDLAWVTFFDASGIRCLLETRAAAGARGGEVVVRHAHPRVRRVLGITGVAEPLGVAANDGEDSPAPAPEVVSVLEDTIDAATRLADGDMVNAQVLDPVSRGLRIVAQRGFGQPFLDFFELVEGVESACGSALAHQEPVWVPDVSRSEIFIDTPALDAMIDADSRAVASIPVQLPTGALVAMFSVHRSRTGEWTSPQRHALAALGRSAGRQLALA